MHESPKIFMAVEWEVPRHAFANDSLFDLWEDNMRSNWYLNRENALGNDDEDILPEIIIDDYGVGGAGYCRPHIFRAAIEELSNAMTKFEINDFVTIHVENVVRNDAMEAIGNNGYFSDTDYKNDSGRLDLVTESIWLVGPKGVACLEEYVRNHGDLTEAMYRIMLNICNNVQKDNTSITPPNH